MIKSPITQDASAARALDKIGMIGDRLLEGLDILADRLADQLRPAGRAV